MMVLAADTSTTFNTVALCQDDRLLAETVVDAGRKHSERLLETVDWLLGEAGIGPDRLELLAIPAGPGSFTGLRVGIAAWKGLALGWGLPLAAVSTLDAMSRICAPEDGLLCPMIDAKMGEVYTALYRFDGGIRTKIMEDRVCTVDVFAQEAPAESITFLGDGASRYRETLVARLACARFVPHYRGAARASAVAAEALEGIAAGISTDPDAVAPIYLRKSQAEQNGAQPAVEGSSP